ncbi:Chaperone J-domain containing protein [Gracilaria domingensis]|nr:Chaperone J-domain containing protein [Gracilaria domingensis]
MAEFKERGNEQYQACNYNSAVELYTAGIEQEPTNAALFSNRSAAYLKLHAYDKARLDADMCIQLDPKWSKGWWRKGTAQLEDQDYISARHTFNEGLQHCPGDENLIAGIEKAKKYIAAVESVQGPGEREKDFNPDDPSKRSAETTTEGTTPKSSDKAASDTEIWPATPEEEILRIKNAPNHYAVLHVSTEATSAQMKKNYYTLARMLHPDKCQLPGAEDAMTSVSQAYDTLTNVVKKTLYDQFLSQTGDDAEHPNQTYQEWESRQQPVELPGWLNFLLSIKGCAWILPIMMLIVLFPVIVILVVLFLILQLVCLPFKLIMRFCFPEKYAQMREEHEREIAKMEEEAQDRMFAHV